MEVPREKRRESENQKRGKVGEGPLSSGQVTDQPIFQRKGKRNEIFIQSLIPR